MNSINAINLALKEILSENDNSVVMGLGVTDPKRIFGTTNDLLELYGEKRIIETPTSENAVTGIALGMALRGFSVCLVHQRFDFALLSFDQIINSISKWKFMFGNDKSNINLLIRMIVGRGWGQGPTHSQSYHSYLASIPGLKVLYPYDVNTFYAAIKYGMTSGEPTIMIEHRWLHNSESNSLDETQEEINHETYVLRKGNELTIFTYGYLVAEAMKAADYLEKQGISIEVVSLVSLSDSGLEKLEDSIQKTGRLLILEPFTLTSSLSTSIMSKLLAKDKIKNCINTYQIYGNQNEHEATSYFQTKERYITSKSIIQYCSRMLDKQINISDDFSDHDVPGDWFKGPF